MLLVLSDCRIDYRFINIIKNTDETACVWLYEYTDKSAIERWNRQSDTILRFHGIVLNSDTADKAAYMIKKLQQASKRVGLRIYTFKTSFITILMVRSP